MSLEGKSAEEIAALAELAEQLANDPKTRKGFMQLSKIANPNAHIPEVDIPLQVNEMMKKGLERLEAAERKNQEYETERNILNRRQALIDNGKASKGDIAAIEKLMIEKKIPDHETAAEFYAMQQKAAEPTPRDARANVRETTMPAVDTKPFKGNLNEWARNMAARTLDELRGKATIKI
jgi:hypothetical protein